MIILSALKEDESLFDQDEIVRRRIRDIKENPSTTKSEAELDAYLRKRGVKIEMVRKRNVLERG